MKFLKIWATVALICAVSAVSFCVGRNYDQKYYNDACRMAGLIRCYEEHLYEEDSDIQDYGCFEELEGIFLYDDALGEPVNLNDYE